MTATSTSFKKSDEFALFEGIARARDKRDPDVFAFSGHIQNLLVELAHYGLKALAEKEGIAIPETLKTDHFDRSSSDDPASQQGAIDIAPPSPTFI